MGTAASLQESLRRQLEGRWERVEQARVRYGELHQQLASRDWRQLLRAQPERLAAVREQEPGVEEVLTYVEHRAQREHWPASHPGLTGLHALRAWRTRLEALARRRLATLTSDTRALLSEVLGLLETLLREPLPEPPRQGVPVLLEDAATFSAGRVWLTPERLLWVPRFAEPVQVLLASLPPGRISSRLGWVHVEGPRTVRVPAGRRARYLVAVLELLRRVAQLREPTPWQGEIVTCRAFCHVQHQGGMADADWGVCVLRPGYVAFLPARPGGHIGHWLLNKDRRDLSALCQEESVVEALRRLPEAEFDAAMESLARAGGGCFWRAGTAELFRPQGQEASQGFRLVSEGRVLTVRPRWPPSRGRLVASLVERWPRYEGPRHLDPTSVLSRVFGRVPSLALILAGTVLPDALRLLVLSVNPPLVLQVNSSFELWLLSALLATWGCCAYAKRKGDSPLLGLPWLATSMFPFPVWPLVLLFRKDRNLPPPLE
jgi:hypothetical protein